MSDTEKKPANNERLRAHCLELALRMPDHSDHRSVLTAAREFEQFVLGRPDEPPMKEA